jgi:hypothetical protein
MTTLARRLSEVIMGKRVLLDAGIFIHSEFAEPKVRNVSVGWGGRESVLEVHGLKRKKPGRDAEYEKQKEALFTVGRLIREGEIEAYSSIEIDFEHFRGTAPIQDFNALRGCQIHKCAPALDRSRFRKTANFTGFIAKGGKKDRRAGIAGEETQIAFLEWLCSLDQAAVNALIEHAAPIGLSQFEIESLGNLAWFQLLCKRSGSAENYPDVFHFWTAERHGFDALLTLEKKLPRLVARVQAEKANQIEMNAAVLRPLDLLLALGISDADPVPIGPDQFYNLY